MRVVAVVVTFNRKELLLECLAGLAAQTHPLERVIVVDNASTDGTPDALRASDLGDRMPLDLVRLSRNGGGSEGFHYGVVEALNGDSDWIWLMDDDCEPKPDALEKLLASRAAQDPATVGVAPRVVDEQDRLLPLHRGRILKRLVRSPLGEAGPEDYEREETQLDFFSFVGPMWRTEVVRRMGPPPRDWFIRFEDMEYYGRARAHGPMWLVNGSEVIHKEPDPMLGLDAKTMFKNIQEPMEFRSLWRYTYGLRNTIAGGRRHGYVSGATALSYVVVQVVRTLLFDERKLRSAYLFALYGYDGWRELYRNVPPGRWAALEHEKDVIGFLNRESMRYDESVAGEPERLGTGAGAGSAAKTA